MTHKTFTVWTVSLLLATAGCSTNTSSEATSTTSRGVTPSGVPSDDTTTSTDSDPTATQPVVSQTETTSSATDTTVPQAVSGSIENLTWSVDSSGEVVSAFPSGNEVAAVIAQAAGTDTEFEGGRTVGGPMDPTNPAASAVAAKNGRTWQVRYTVTEPASGLPQCEAGVAVAVLPAGAAGGIVADEATKMVFPKEIEPKALPGTPVGSKTAHWNATADSSFPMQSASVMSDRSVIVFSGVKCVPSIDGVGLSVGLAQTLLNNLSGATYDPGLGRGVYPNT